LSRNRLKEKVNRRTDGQTDGPMDAGQIAMAIAHLSLRLRWANNRV